MSSRSYPRSKGKKRKGKGGKGRRGKGRRGAPIENATRLARLFERDNDCVVELVPKFTRHAKQRLQQGRQGSYVCKPNRGKNKKRMEIITVLPYGHNHNIPPVHANARKKDPSLRNKCKQLVKTQYYRK